MQSRTTVGHGEGSIYPPRRGLQRPPGTSVSGLASSTREEFLLLRRRGGGGVSGAPGHSPSSLSIFQRRRLSAWPWGPSGGLCQLSSFCLPSAFSTSSLPSSTLEPSPVPASLSGFCSKSLVYPTALQSPHCKAHYPVPISALLRPGHVMWGRSVTLEPPLPPERQK